MELGLYTTKVSTDLNEPDANHLRPYFCGA
jgi:hypothetical protein